MASKAKQQRNFLTLPPEIRLLILKLLQHQNPRQPVKTSCDLSIDGWHRSYATIGASNRGNNVYDTSFSFTDIRAVNRQLYRETLEFIRFPELTVRFWGYIEEESMLSDALTSIMKYNFIREHLVDVYFHFYCCDMRNECSKWKLLTKKPILNRPNLWLPWRRPEPCLKSIDVQEYQKLIEGLDKCPQLRNMFTCLEHGDLLAWWPEPVRDFDPFGPLLKRGVRIHIEVKVVSHRVDTFKVYDGMMEMLNRGAGEIVMCMDPSQFSKERVVLSLRKP